MPKVPKVEGNTLVSAPEQGEIPPFFVCIHGNASYIWMYIAVLTKAASMEQPK
jgi:hypothetical protein